MSDEMTNMMKSEELAAYILQLIKDVQGGVVDKLPSFIDELMRWEFIKNISLFILFLFISIISCVCIWKIAKNTFRESGNLFDMNNSFMAVIAILISALGAMICIPLSINTAFDTVKMVVAPNVYLVDILKNFY